MEDLEMEHDSFLMAAIFEGGAYLLANKDPATGDSELALSCFTTLEDAREEFSGCEVLELVRYPKEGVRSSALIAILALADVTGEVSDSPFFEELNGLLTLAFRLGQRHPLK